VQRLIPVETLAMVAGVACGQIVCALCPVTFIEVGIGKISITFQSPLSVAIVYPVVYSCRFPGYSSFGGLYGNVPRPGLTGLLVIIQVVYVADNGYLRVV
jgi:hypothetical protein